MTAAQQAFAPVNELETEMLRALKEPSRMSSFYGYIGRAELIVPLFVPHDRVFDPHVFKIVRVDDHEGVAAYTSIEQLALAGSSGGPSIKATGSQLAAGWDEDTSLLLNPGGALGLRIEAAVVRAWAAQAS